MWPEDKDLEYIFREGSAKHDHSYDPGAWEQMNAMLNKQRRRKFFIWFIIGVVIVLGSLSLYQFVNSDKGDDANPMTESYTEIGHISARTPTKNESTKSNTSILNDTKEQADLKNQQVLSPENSASVSSGIKPTVSDNIKSKNTAIPNEATSYKKQNIIASGETLSQISYKTNTQENETLPSLNNQVSGSVTPSAQIIQSEQFGKTTGISDIATNKLDSKNWNNNLPSLRPLNITYLDARFQVQKTPSFIDDVSISTNSFQRFLLSGFTGIESSWTPNSEFSSIDISIGVKGSYLLSKKVAFSLGLNYRADKYTAGQDDYITDPSFWENGVTPMFTDADNDMLEISTGLIYTPAGAHKSGFLISGHFISNMMLKESYNYHFDNPDHDFQSSWARANGTLFSNLELGIGYRRQLQGGFSMEFSPYVKIPMNGIGHGKLMLSSYGLRMAVNLGL